MCKVARPLGMIAQWALMQDNDGPVLNYYGPGEMSAVLPSGARFSVRQETDYPRDGAIRLCINVGEPEIFTLKLRIPAWSRDTLVALNGVSLPAPEAGAYLALHRQWKSGDIVELTLDLSLRMWRGEKEYSGRISIYRGPLLLAYDARFNTLDPHELPELDGRSLAIEPQAWEGPIPPWFLASLRDAAGHEYRVCDLSSAGQVGTHYRSWLPASGVAAEPEHPRWHAWTCAARPTSW